MLAINVTKEIRNFDLFDLVEILIDEGVKSIEVDLITDVVGKLILCLNNDVRLSRLEPLYLNELFKLLKDSSSSVQMILNFKEANLESRALFLTKKWDLTRQIKYSGEIEPSHLSLWDRLHVIYDIENCLPNITELAYLKHAHMDVINYFCTKYQVKTIRIDMRLVTEEVIAWCNELNLKLSVMDAETIEVAWGLEKMGVDQVSVEWYSEIFKMNGLSKKQMT